MSTLSRQSLIAIVGPTGVGKTAYAAHAAKVFNAELLSVDSRQIYAGMDIATGKEADMGKWVKVNGRKTLNIEDVLIHGLDIVEPDESFSVFDWYQLATTIILEIHARGKQPILVGGTGFYLNALQGKIDSLHIGPNHGLRYELEQLSNSELVERLQSIEVEKRETLDVQNKRKLIRAIEVAEAGDQEAVTRRQEDKFYDLKMIGLMMEREKLYQKVDARVDAMVAGGLIEETKELLDKYDPTISSMTGIGYAEVADFLAGKLSQDEAIQKIKWRIHAYIRRQYTWFNKQNVEWIDVGKTGWKDKADELIRSYLPA